MLKKTEKTTELLKLKFKKMSKLLNPQLEFDKFIDAIGLNELPKDSAQYTEMRRTFYSGMMCMFGKLAFELPEIADEEAANAELQAMFKALKEAHMA
jgi:hypothetical protein